MPFGKRRAAELAYATDVGSDVPLQKKKKTKFKLLYQALPGKGKPQAELAAADDGSGFHSVGEFGEPAPAGPPGKKGKKKKEKKDKDGKQSHKLVIGLCCGAVLVGVSAAVILVTVSGSQTVEKRLEKAAGYTDKAQYEKADEIYTELLVEDVTLVPAYLGASDNFLAQEDSDGAIEVLARGYEMTEDVTIERRLDALRPAEDEAEPEQPVYQPIVWKDSALEQMVRRAMPQLGTGEITEEDLESVHTIKIVGGTHVSISADADNAIRNLNTAEGYTIDGELYTERGEIRSLSDIAHFRNLKKLIVGYNQISDISGLEGLTGLETVGLYFNDISDVTPLSGLPNLKYVYLYHNNISDISPLSSLPAVRSLYLQNNNITDLSPLRGTQNLVHLYISENQVSDISAVSSMNGLAILMAEDNGITDLSPVQGLSGLTDVDFSGNPASDYAPTRNIQNVN